MTLLLVYAFLFPIWFAGGAATVEVEPDTTVWQLKIQLWQKKGIPPPQIGMPINDVPSIVLVLLTCHFQSSFMHPRCYRITQGFKISQYLKSQLYITYYDYEVKHKHAKPSYQSTTNSISHSSSHEIIYAGYGNYGALWSHAESMALVRGMAEYGAIIKAVSVFDTLHHINQRLCQSNGLDPAMQSYYCGARKLLDMHRPLADMGVEIGSVVTMKVAVTMRYQAAMLWCDGVVL